MTTIKPPKYLASPPTVSVVIDDVPMSRETYTKAMEVLTELQKKVHEVADRLNDKGDSKCLMQ